MKINSIGTFTPATEFVPLFPKPQSEFKPLVIRRIDYEDKETETQKPASSTSASTQSGITPQDQQAASPKAEQAQP